MAEQQRTLVILLKRFFGEHPTLLLSLCYFVITVIGVLYHYYFYREFGINIIKFADLSDFLLVAVLEPMSLLLFIVSTITIAVIYKMEMVGRAKFKAYGRFVGKRRYSKYIDLTVFSGAMVMTLIVYIQSLAQGNAEEVRSGIIDQYAVRIADFEQGSANLALLGSSSRYVYFFDVSKDQALVVPVESVSYMKKVPLKAKTTDKTNAKTRTKANRLEKLAPTEKKN